MKHVIKMFFVLLLSCCFVVPANALESQCIDAPNINSFGIGILTLDDGTQIEVEGEIVDTVSTLDYNSDKSITYKYNLPSVAGAGVSVSNYFTRNTGFTDYISDAYEAVLGANLILTYKMGSSRTWSFTLTNNLFNV